MSGETVRHFFSKSNFEKDQYWEGAKEEEENLRKQ